jgi:hypothetical protein
MMRGCDTQLRLLPKISRPAGRTPWLPVPHLLLSVIVLAGCQGSSLSVPTYEVKGKVLLPTRKALTAGRVTFVAEDGLLPQASGEIGTDGAFCLTTRSPGDGAAPGKYKVRIEPAGSKNPRKTKPDFPVKYVDEDSSGLVVTVRSEPNQLEPFTLK